MRTSTLAVLIAAVACCAVSGVLAITCSSSIVLSSPNRRQRQRLPLTRSLAAVGAPLKQQQRGDSSDTSSGELSDDDIVCRGVVASVAAAPVSTPATATRSPSGFVESVLEVGMTTVGSFASGGAFGYVIGLGIGAFQKGGFRQGMPVLLKNMHTKACSQGMQWGSITAAFAGFGSAAKVIRRKDDKWNSVLGSCGAGAYMSKDKGPMAMLQGALFYGGFSYVLDNLGGGAPAPDELNFVDVPVAPTVEETSQNLKKTARSARRSVDNALNDSSSSSSSSGRKRVPLRRL